MKPPKKVDLARAARLSDLARLMGKEGPDIPPEGKVQPEQGKGGIWTFTMPPGSSMQPGYPITLQWSDTVLENVVIRGVVGSTVTVGPVNRVEPVPATARIEYLGMDMGALDPDSNPNTQSYACVPPYSTEHYVNPRLPVGSCFDLGQTQCGECLDYVRRRFCIDGVEWFIFRDQNQAWSAHYRTHVEPGWRGRGIHIGDNLMLFVDPRRLVEQLVASFGNMMAILPQHVVPADRLGEHVIVNPFLNPEYASAVLELESV